MKKTAEKERVIKGKEERKRKRDQKKSDEEVKKKLRDATKSASSKITSTKANRNEKENQKPFEKENRSSKINKVANKTRVTNELIEIGNYVIVNFEGELYPGIVTALNENRALISAMEKYNLNNWKWPQEKDEIWYDLNEVEDVIESPEEINEKGVYFVKEITELV